MYALNRNPHLFTLAVVLAAFVAVPASAQSHRGAIGLTGGGSVHSDLAPGLSESALFQPGWITGLQLERWLGAGRTGLRLNTLWTQRRLDDVDYYNYNVVVAETDVLVRLRRPEASNAFMPFVAVGAGATHYGGVAGTGPLAGGAYGSNPVFRAHVMASLGADLMASRRSGLRLEVADQIVLPSIGLSPGAEGLPRVHNLVVTMALQLRTGSLGNETVRMRPETPVRAAPEPAPSPTPAADGPARSELEDRLAEKDREIERLRSRIESLEARLADRAPADAPSEVVEAEFAAAADAGARFTVQIGSFVESATADRWVNRLQRRGLPVWRSDTEVQGQAVSRVRVGALGSETEARNLADLLKQDYGWPVWVDRIQDAEAVPADAVADTRSVLYRR